MAGNRVDLNLKASLCTDTPAGTPIYDFKDPEAEVEQNTGIERNGGVTNLYQQQTAHTDAAAGVQFAVAKNGKLLEVQPAALGSYPDRALVKIDGRVIGKVSSYGVKYRLKVESYDDAVLTTDGTVLCVRYNPAVASGYIAFDVVELSMAGLVLNSRTTTFGAVLSTTGEIPRHVVIVRTRNQKYADNLEFLIERGTSYLCLCQESGLAITGSSITWYGGSRRPYGYKLENGYYLIGSQGEAGLSWNIWNPTGWSSTALTGVAWAIPQIYNSKTRFIVTKYLPTINVNNIEMIGVVGYTDFSAYTGTIAWATTVAAGTPTSIQQYLTGYNYGEIRFRKGASDAYLTQAPFFGSAVDSTNMYHIRDTECENEDAMPIYGKLNATYNASGNNHAIPVEYRVCLIPQADFPYGLQAYISAAWSSLVTGAPTNGHLGVALSAVGEFDPTYTPQVSEDETAVLWAYQGNFFVVKVGTDPSVRFQEIAPNVYKLNTISPLNILDADEETLEVGSCDFNSRFYFTSTTDAATAHRWAMVIRGKYSDSIDTGEKVISLDTTYGVDNPIGFALPYVDRPSLKYAVDLYFDGEYARSYLNAETSTLATFVDPQKSGMLYVQSQLLPVPMGATYGRGIARNIDRTFFLAPAYKDNNGDLHEVDGYVVGGEIVGDWISFSLFGQTYIHDGNNIYLVTFEGNVFSEKVFAAPATGMSYIASSPTLIYFLSAFDNSIYVFNGGRELVKLRRMNNLETITDGVFNVRDNTLCLQTANTLIWVRDDVVSLNTKLAAQTSTRLYDTISGVVVLNDSYKWIYSYLALSGSTVVALAWQSPYLGLKSNVRSITADWTITIYAPTRTAAIAVTVTCNSFDEDGFSTAAKTVVLNPSDWTALGYVRIRHQPKNQRALASSIKIESTSQIVITDVSVEWTDEAAAVPRATRSM